MLKTAKTPFVTKLNHNKFIKKHDDVKREHKITSLFITMVIFCIKIQNGHYFRFPYCERFGFFVNCNVNVY